MTLNNVLVSVALRRAAHPGGVRAGVFWFGHGEAAANLSGQQWFEETFLLFGRAIFDQDLHITGVWGLAIKDIMT